MSKPSPRLSLIVGVQVLVLGAFAIAYASLSDPGKREVLETVTQQPQPPELQIPRTEPLFVTPLYNEPELVTDEELLAVLNKVLPRFPEAGMKPNHVEHALRIWTTEAEFPRVPEAMSGAEMTEFLTDHGRYLASWGDNIDPLLQPRSTGVEIRYGSGNGASVHHDHWLASLTEAGISIDDPLHTPRNVQTVRQVLEKSLWDFKLDETEIEWSAMAFGLWLPPQRSWITSEDQEVTFDMLAERLMMGGCGNWGVCASTHRVYSLMLLWRLSQEQDILSEAMEDRVYAHLETVRDLIMISQFEDGHWSSDWHTGAYALEAPLDEPHYRTIIATSHHLEWLAIAPKELHPPREMIEKAMRYVIDDTTTRSQDYILGKYTFYSHVGNALALWRGTRPHEFWMGRGQELPIPADVASDDDAEDEAAEDDDAGGH